EAGLPADAFALPVPAGATAAYVHGDSMVQVGSRNLTRARRTMARILVVDDEEGIRKVLRQLLEYVGHEVRVATSGGEALGVYPEFRPDIVFLDVKMARMDGLEVLARLREQDPSAIVVMISGHGTIETAVEATRRGAYDFLEKPLDTDRILLTIRNALQQ